MYMTTYDIPRSNIYSGVRDVRTAVCSPYIICTMVPCWYYYKYAGVFLIKNNAQMLRIMGWLVPGIVPGV